jgi:hypothetical protein
VDLYVQFLLHKGIENQFVAFREGFDSVCANSAISIFRPEEIELLVCGSNDVDFESLQRVTTYDGGFSPETPVIQYVIELTYFLLNSICYRNFWKIVLEFTEQQKKQLLFFATGTDRVPVGGFSKLNFVIAKNGPDSDR